MPLSIIERPDQRVVEVHVTGKLSRSDYQQFVPEIERFVAVVGKVSLLVIMHDFHGWDAGGLWEDIKFDLKHYSHLEKIALVGETHWQSMMSTVCKPFTRGEVRYFDEQHSQEAREWLDLVGEPAEAH